MTDSLQIADFPQFFSAVNGGADPFPWQVRLAKQVDWDGRWPSLLNLPTGSGKTAAIDIAVFLRALRDDQPRRIVFVVDRRVIVHQAFQRAKAIAESLETSNDPIVQAVARRLRSAAYDRGLPTTLVTAELRGGIAHDETWAMRPDIPAVLVSTVDQVGSRLLFRGYGVSRGMRPVHAGLLGNDTVFMLDEVHLARPFKETLRSVGQYYRHLGPLPDRWQIVELTATPDRVTTDAIQLEPKDRDNPVLGRRLSARKPVTLWPAKERGVDGDHQRAAVADACVDRVDSMADLPQVRRIGVVVNRVATAVAIYQRLTSYQRLARRFPDAVLLTGRMRPFDREDIDASLRDQWLLGRDRRAAGDLNVLVSTQAIEAGADLDLDGLVTECAPFDALVQRFGRVDRNGFLSQAGTPAPGFIVATGGQRSAKVDDAIYGPALTRTWQWLESLPDLDFGPDRRPVAGEIESLDMQIHPPDPPILLPVHLRAWAQTSPPPHADPDPDLWLHGLRDRADLDVSIVWRADLGDLSAWDRDTLVDWVSACPPTTGEAMAVPIGAAKAWLTFDHDGGSGTLDDISDVDGLVPDSPPEGRHSRLPGYGRAVLLWRADDQSDLGHARDLRPGDTMVVPASYGGVTGGSWDPRSSAAVVDLGLRSQVARKSRIVLRLVEELLPGAGCPLAAVDSEGEVDVEDLDQAAVVEWLRSPSLVAWCQGHTDEPEPATLDRTALKVLDALRDEDSLVKWSTRRLGRPGDHTALVLVAQSPATVANAAGATCETVDSEPDTSSFIGQKVTLDQHLKDVGEWAGAMATKCGLPSEVAGDLALAGAIHDLGKADPRFQQLLRLDGPVSDELLAKSAGPPTKRADRRLAQRRSGYPDRCRHELLSTFLASLTPEIEAKANDWDLVLHLVASHHGHGRPGVPVAVDDDPVEVRVPFDGVTISGTSDHHLHRLDAPIAERFWAVTDRYGFYGLAWMEAILRLADHRASAERQGGRQ